nr:leucine-rich repeat domain-containing protein [Candidatus Sigynarchaeota archaeon]
MAERFRFPVFIDGITCFKFDDATYEKNKHYLYYKDLGSDTLSSMLGLVPDPSSILWLEIENSSVSKLSDIKKFNNLIRLVINNCKIEKIEGLEGMKSLVYLDLRGNLLTRIEGLDQLRNLEFLNLAENQIEKIERLDALGGLKHLDLNANRIRKVEGLDALANLKYLDLSKNRFTSFEKLSQILDIEQLILQYNPLNARREAIDARMIELRNIYQKFMDAENVQYILILMNSGLPLYSKAFSNVPIDENLISGFLSAISSFGAEIGTKIGRDAGEIGGLEQLSYGQFKIILNEYKITKVALLLLNDASDTLKNKLKTFNVAFYEHFKGVLDGWRGQALPSQEITDIVEQVFDMELAYLHNLVDFKADEREQEIDDASIEKFVLRAMRDDPFNNFFHIKGLMEHSKLFGKDEIEVFDVINKLKQSRIVYPLNPKIQQVILNYTNIVDQLSTDLKKILVLLHDKKNPKENLKSLEEIDQFYINMAALEQLGLVEKDSSLTRIGEELAYYLAIFFDD